MNEATEIIQGTIQELESREEQLQEQIRDVQEQAKAELKDVQATLKFLRRRAEKAASNGAAPSVEVTDETKDAVMRELESKSQDGAGGARPSGIAKVANLQPAAVKQALSELQESGDVESYGKGLWRISE